MNRGYTYFDVKAADEDNGRRIIQGVASTITPDRMEDIVEPKGAQYRLPVPLLSQHTHHLPIGLIHQLDVSGKKIEIEAEVSSDSGLDYIEFSWKQIKAKLVRGLSIGFRALEYSFIEATGGVHIKEWELLEVSAVTVPANAEATITAIKNFDQDPKLRARALAASGIHHEVKRALAMRRAMRETES